MPVPAICLLKSMTCTRCSQAITWHCAGVYGSICRPRWRAQRSCRPCRIFLASHPELELEVSSTDSQVDLLIQEGFDCVLRLGPIRDDTLVARPLRACCARPTLPVPPIWRAMASLDRWKISSVRDIGQFIFRRCWAQDPLDGNIRTATATRRFSCQVRYTSTARRPTKPRPSPALA